MPVTATPNKPTFSSYPIVYRDASGLQTPRVNVIRPTHDCSYSSDRLRGSSCAMSATARAKASRSQATTCRIEMQGGRRKVTWVMVRVEIS